MASIYTVKLSKYISYWIKELEIHRFLLRDKSFFQKILLILDNPLEISRYDLRVSAITQFEKTFMDDEKYYLYFVYPLNP